MRVGALVAFACAACFAVLASATTVDATQTAPPVSWASTQSGRSIDPAFMTTDDPALFNLAVAEAKLESLTFAIVTAETAIENARSEIISISGERAFLELGTGERALLLADTQSAARRRSVNAYVGIGPPGAGVTLLAATSATDLTYRNAILRQQAEALTNTANLYAALLGQADSDVLSMSAQIDEINRRIESVSRELAELRSKLPYAEWVVSIAQIHSKADKEFARSNRVEPTAEQWRKLRHCESTETYNIDTGNTFYGAYQFTWQTWGTVGGEGNPAHTPPAEQDARARYLFSTRGRQPWPICGRFLPR